MKIDGPRIARTGQKFLMSVGVLTIGGWLPAQNWLIALGALTMFAPMFYLLYLMEGKKASAEKVEGHNVPDR